jgi:hypothetical protein
MHIQQYPYLTDLLGGYFHQDAFDDGETDDDIIREFVATSHAYQRLGVRADAQRFVHQHRGELVKAIQAAFSPAVTLAESEAEWEQWFEKLERMLRE